MRARGGRRERRSSTSMPSSPGLTRGSIRRALLICRHRRSGILGRPGEPGHDELGYVTAFQTHLRILAARIAPEFCKFIDPQERAQCYPKKGAGKTGCALHPRSRVQDLERDAHEHTGSAEAVRPSLRNGFTAYFALSLATGFLSPSSLRSLLLKNLTPASGRQDHTTSPSASRAVRQKRIRVHRIPPHVRDDRETPLVWDGMAHMSR